MKSFILICVLVLLMACGPPPRETQKTTYPQDFKSNEAYLVLEFNSKPMIMASGFLANRELGTFYTAKHFTDGFGSLGPEYCRVFFNGQVFKAIIVRVPPTRDAALIRILPPFSVKDFPEPARFATKRPSVGENIHIRGFHPHAYWIRKENEEEGFPDKVVEILEPYYGQIMKDMNRETQVVFHDLEGTVVRPNPNPLPELRELENDSYIKVLMPRDHKFSFGGLSGGAALNKKGEIVGIITAQDIYRFEFDDLGFFLDPHRQSLVQLKEVKKQIFDTVYITPIESVLDLDEYMKQLHEQD